MDFFDAVKARRSVRKYTAEAVPEAVVQKALDAALIAPNSSNMQTWEFYWVKDPAKKSKLVEACLSQGAAKTAQELVVVVATAKHWKRNQQEMVRIMKTNNAPAFAFSYYEKLMPMVYGFQWLAPFKWLLWNAIALTKPMMRGPWSYRDRQEVMVKSAALASENFMLAISAQGFATCPMEGFDERRVKKILQLSCSERVVMVISVGRADEQKGTWGPQIRFNRDWFVKIV